MLPSSRSHVLDGFPFLAFIFIATLLPVPAHCQSPSATSNSPGQKPATREITVITNESIGLSLVSHAAKSSSSANPQPTPALEKNVGTAGRPKKAAQIAALRKQF